MEHERIIAIIVEVKDARISMKGLNYIDRDAAVVYRDTEECTWDFKGLSVTQSLIVITAWY